VPFERLSTSLDQTAALAGTIALALRPGDVLALDGPMGAGKTTFVRALADALGVPAGMVSSPTFVLAHHYPTRAGWTLVHIDAYRIRSGEDLEAMGWDRLADPRDVLVIEWADRVAPALPAARVSWMRINAVGVGTGDSGIRKIVVEGAVGGRLERGEPGVC
jgi:tRNA threonylcarbamoyladenosine biosynthesis protein TsaE